MVVSAGFGIVAVFVWCMAVVRRIPGGCVFTFTLFSEVKQESILLWLLIINACGR
jgi:hypothetical protein